VDIDRQAIERRDFPITRRGYEPAAVDAHLRALAAEIEELQRERASGGGEPSLSATAGTQVQSILAAAEAAAADIERQARDEASATRDASERDAAGTRNEAIAQARAHVAAVAQATAVLLERVGTVDGEVAALLESLRGGAGRLASDLAALDVNMGELYDAASGSPATRAVAGEAAAQPSVPAPPLPPATPLPDAAAPVTPRPAAAAPAPPLPAAAAPASPRPAAAAPAPPLTPPPASGAAAPQVKRARDTPPPLAPDERAEPSVHVDPEAPAGTTEGNGDLDSARLVALNMALNGESREDTARYLAENYELADQRRLVDEVYAAVEG
jgi:hypothetical protein